MNDKFAEFLKLLGKMLQFPHMTPTEAETALIKEFLEQVLDNNPNYGPQTKQIFKVMLAEAKSPMSLATEIETYFTTHDVSK